MKVLDSLYKEVKTIKTTLKSKCFESIAIGGTNLESSNIYILCQSKSKIDGDSIQVVKFNLKSTALDTSGKVQVFSTDTSTARLFRYRVKNST